MAMIAAYRLREDLNNINMHDNDAVMPSDLTKLVLLITLASCLHVFMRVSTQQPKLHYSDHSDHSPTTASNSTYFRVPNCFLQASYDLIVT